MFSTIVSSFAINSVDPLGERSMWYVFVPNRKKNPFLEDTIHFLR